MLWLHHYVLKTLKKPWSVGSKVVWIRSWALTSNFGGPTPGGGGGGGGISGISRRSGKRVKNSDFLKNYFEQSRDSFSRCFPTLTNSICLLDRTNICAIKSIQKGIKIWKSLGEFWQRFLNFWFRCSGSQLRRRRNNKTSKVTESPTHNRFHIASTDWKNSFMTRSFFEIKILNLQTLVTYIFLN